MLELFTRPWAAVMVRGAAALAFGLTALIWPGITLLSLTALFGAYTLVDGAVALGLVWPGVTAVALQWLIAGWAMATGVLRIVTAVRLRREIRDEWLLGISGVLSAAFGVLLVVWPSAGALAVVFLIGTYAIAAGVALLGTGWRMRRLRRALPSNGFAHPSPSHRADAA
jgi:uncharacterized membrane protein HdeD (DUF308 family)